MPRLLTRIEKTRIEKTPIEKMPIERKPVYMKPRVMAAHISEDDLESFVVETLTPEQNRRVLTHVVECGPCARRLVRETVLIETLRETLRLHRRN